MKKLIFLVLTMTFLGACAHKQCSCSEKKEACAQHKDGSKQDGECKDCKTNK